MVKVSICTTTARRGFVEHQARMLAAQVRDWDLEWILIDFAFEERAATVKNLSNDLKLPIIHLPNVRDHQRFFRDITRNRNLALAHATGDYIIFLDDYAAIPPSFTAYHLAVMRTNAISCGNMWRLEGVPHTDLKFDDYEALKTEYAGRFGRDHRNADGPDLRKIVGQTYTGNVGFPRGVSDLLNGFDPRMESGLEDCDFGLRAYGAGFVSYFNRKAETINLWTGHLPYTYHFDHAHDVEPFISNPNNNFRGNAKLQENEFMTVAFHDHYRIAHCKICGAHGMIDPNELIDHKAATKEAVVPSNLPGGLDTLRKEYGL